MFKFLSVEGKEFLLSMQTIANDCLQEIGSNPKLLNLKPRPKADFVNDYFRQSLLEMYPDDIFEENNTYYFRKFNFGIIFKKGERKRHYLPKLNKTKRSVGVINKDPELFEECKLEPLFLVWDTDKTWSKFFFFIGQLETRKQWEWIQSLDQYTNSLGFFEKTSTLEIGTYDYSIPVKVEFKDDKTNNDSEEVAV